MDPVTMAALANAAVQLFSSLKGSGGGGDKMKKISNYSKEQEKYFKDYTKQAQQGLGGQQDAMGLLQSMLDPNSDFFKNFENQQMNQFNEQTLPNIAERFAGGGALSSSGFGQALGGAASGLQSNLAAGKSNLIMQALQQLLGQYNQQTQNVLNAQPFDYINKQGGGGATGGFMQGLSNMSGQNFQDIFGLAQQGYQGYQNSNLLNQAQGIKG